MLAMGAQQLGAQTYPTRTVHLIVGFPPGGAGDGLARLLAAEFSKQLGKPVIVENRPGAGSIVATRTMLNLPADGHAILLMGSSTVANGLLREGDYPTLLQSLVPVAGLTVSTFAIVVNSSAPQMTLADLISYARAHPTEINAGTYGVGTQSHLAAQLFCKYAGVDMTLVPYGGSAPLMNDLLARHIDVAFDGVGSALPHVKSGALRALAVTADKRLARLLPEVPAARELLPDYEIVTWTGLAVREGTAPDIVERLNRESNAVLTLPLVLSRMADLGLDAMPFGQEAFGAFWSTEVKRTRVLIREAGLQ